MNETMQLLKRALRNIRLRAVSSAVIVVTLAVASGPMSAVIGLSVPREPTSLAGISAPQGLVRLTTAAKGTVAIDHLSYPEFLDVRREAHTLTGVATIYREGADVASPHGDGSGRVALVSGNYFALMGATVQRGRPITTGDEATGNAEPIAVLSDEYWRSAFGARADIVGQMTRVNGAVTTVVGVARAGFTGTDVGDPVDVWIPLATHAGFANVPDLLASRTERALAVIGRLRPGAPAAGAAQEIGYIGSHMNAANPDPAGPRRYSAEPLPLTEPHRGTDDLSLGIWVLVALVLATACFNIAGMFLARAVAEEQKTAVRLMLGSGIRRLLTDAFAEGSILSVVGIAIGAVLAVWLFDLISAHVSAVDGYAIDRWGGGPGRMLSLEWKVFAAAGAVGLVTATTFVTLPLLHWRRIDLANVLKAGQQGPRPRVGQARDLLVVLQLALAIVVTASAITLGRTIQQLRRANPGFSTAGLVSVSLSFLHHGRSLATGPAIDLELTAAADAVPGVSAAGIGMAPLLQFADGFQELVRTNSGDAQAVQVAKDVVGPGYFRALRVRMVEGRDFTPSDGPNAPDRVIVNEAMARKLWPGESAVGRQIELSEGSTSTTWNGSFVRADVIGVVSNFNSWYVGNAPTPTFFASALQGTLLWGYLYARVSGPQARDSLGAAVRHALGAGEFPPVVRPVEDSRERGMSFDKNAFLGATLLGAIAFIVAIVGLYGMLIHTVTQRTREIGIRIALGASRGAILWGVGRHALQLTALGVMLAIPCVIGLVHLLRSIVYGTGPLDPVVGGATIAFLAVATLAGSVVPAFSATRVDPLAAIRSE